MNNQKYLVFFRRVSTAGQDLAMQASADAFYRLDPETIVIIDEDATFANKKSIGERPEMKKLIELIKQDRIRSIHFTLLIVPVYLGTIMKPWNLAI